MLKKTTKKKTKKIIIANWKMNPDTMQDAKKIFSDLKNKKLNPKKAKVVICPPSVYLAELSMNYRGQAFSFGAQDVFWSDKGEHTGEISTEMLKNLRADWVIVGHAEKRAIGENDQMVATKAKRVIDEGMKAVVCIGEPHRDDHGQFLRFIENQLRDSLSLISKKKTDNLVIAYEPVWAIGKGKKPPTSHELHQISLFIKKILSSIYNREIAMSIPIIYGGSVDEENCRELVDIGNVNGLLVGRASLNPHIFSNIIKELDK